MAFSLWPVHDPKWPVHNAKRTLTTRVQTRAPLEGEVPENERDMTVLYLVRDPQAMADTRVGYRRERQ